MYIGYRGTQATNLNQTLISARLDAGYRKTTLARKCGVYVQTIGLIEKNATRPSERLANRISSALGRDVNYLFPNGVYTNNRFSKTRIEYNTDLAEARIRAGYSQSALAKKVGITPAAICACENLDTCLGESTARKIADVLGADVDKIFPEWATVISHDNVREQRALERVPTKFKNMLPIDVAVGIETKNGDIGIYDLRDVLKIALGCLQHDERCTIELRYGIRTGYRANVYHDRLDRSPERASFTKGDNLYSSQSEVGKVLGISHTMVDLNEAKALRKMKIVISAIAERSRVTPLQLLQTLS